MTAVRLAMAAIIALTALAPAAAHAQTGGAATAEAERLFERGLKDMLEGRYNSGCPALAKSFELDPQPGAMFTLAECELKADMLVTARGHFQQYLSLFDGLSDDEQQAQRGRKNRAIDQIAVIDQRAPTVILQLPAGAPNGTEVVLDGERVARESLVRPRRVDPGVHRVMVVLPTGERREHVFTVAEGDHEAYALGMPMVGSQSPADGVSESSDWGPMHTGAVVAGSIGVVGIVIGAVTGGLVFAKKGTIADNCDGAACNAEGKDAADSAQSLATVSTIGFAVGAVGVATGVLLWALAPDGSSSGESPSDDATAWRPFLGVGDHASGGVIVGVEGVW